ncbi:hypothetical protein [Streptomyces sp. NPDC102437]|uniref:hypothetical protein n=1 Tax=Streptomyces sp. NPDC102437 TaxID=3366175 RepID=UPI0038025826
MAGTVGSVSTPDLDAFVLCDDDGAGTVTPFLRRYTPGVAPGYVDTALDGTTPYTVTGTVGTCAPNPTPDAEVSTALHRYTAAATPDLKALYPGLQSATVTVLAGTVAVTTTGAADQPVPAGVALTWSTNDGDDSSLSALSLNIPAGADVLVSATYKASAAG